MIKKKGRRSLKGWCVGVVVVGYLARWVDMCGCACTRARVCESEREKDLTSESANLLFMPFTFRSVCVFLQGYFISRNYSASIDNHDPLLKPANCSHVCPHPVSLSLLHTPEAFIWSSWLENQSCRPTFSLNFLVT